jgi:hypothetical protein
MCTGRTRGWRERGELISGVKKKQKTGKNNFAVFFFWLLFSVLFLHHRANHTLGTIQLKMYRYR